MEDLEEDDFSGEDFDDLPIEEKVEENPKETKKRAKNLLDLAEQREKFWESISNQAKNYPSLFVEGYYEIIKELSNVLLILDGWKVDDQDCLFILKTKEEIEVDHIFLSELKKLRDEIKNQGTKINYSSWQEKEGKAKEAIKILKEYIKNKIK